MNRFLICFLLLSLFISIAPAVEPVTDLDYEAIRDLPVLDGGRVKPIDTLAGETIKALTGRWSYEDYDHVALFFSILAFPQEWMEEDIILIHYHPLKETLGFSQNQKYFSYSEITNNQRFKQLAQNVWEKSSADQDLNRLERAMADLMHKVNLFQEVIGGNKLAIVPPPPGSPEEEAWTTVSDTKGYSSEDFSSIQHAYHQLVSSVQNRDNNSFIQTAGTLQTQLRKLSPEIYPSQTRINQEIYYNQSRPFMISWIFYLIAFFLLLVSYFYTNKYIYWSGIGLFIIGFLYHTLGLLLRALISGRPPVSNMYETVVFVGWGIIFFSLIFEMIYRRRWFVTCASLLGVGMLILADILPFESNIEPLVPVLRSNYWLIIHVLTITISYSAFALAMGLAHVILAIYFYFPGKSQLLRELSLFIYRVIQVGVVLLAAGTILGGVWAAESWGRFWGWDPKETWSLISLLGYMAVLHARYSGWLRDFGTAICSIIGFWLILMTWYGVNFVLSTGLHSYGFGSGGGMYIIAYLVAEILFLSVVAWKYKTSSSSDLPAEPSETSIPVVE